MIYDVGQVFPTYTFFYILYKYKTCKAIKFTKNINFCNNYLQIAVIIDLFTPPLFTPKHVHVMLFLLMAQRIAHYTNQKSKDLYENM